MKETAQKLIKKYGEEYEKRKILEEMTELSQEIWRDLNHNKAKRMKILEERVDVEFMMKMIDCIYDFTERDFKEQWIIKKEKIEREYLI